MNKKKLQKVLNKDVVEAFESLMEDFTPPANSKYIIFEGIALTDSGDTVELPTIRYQYRN